MRRQWFTLWEKRAQAMDVTPNKPGGLMDAAVTGSKGKSTADLASFGNVAVSFTTMVQKAGNKMLRQGSSPEIEQANADAGGRSGGYDEPESEINDVQTLDADHDDDHNQNLPPETDEAPLATSPNDAPEEAPVYDNTEAPRETTSSNDDLPQDTVDDGADDNADMASVGDDTAQAQTSGNSETTTADTQTQTGADVVADLGSVLVTAETAVTTAQTDSQSSRIAPVEAVIEQLQQAKNPSAVLSDGKAAGTKSNTGGESGQQNQNMAGANTNDDAFLDGLLGKKGTKLASTKASAQGQQASAAKADNAAAHANANAQLRADPLSPAQMQAQQLAKTLNDPKANVRLNVTVDDEAKSLTSKPTASLTPTAVQAKAAKSGSGQQQAQGQQGANTASTAQAGQTAQVAQTAQVLAQLAQGANAQNASGTQTTNATTTTGGGEGVNATASTSAVSGTQPGQTLQQATGTQKPATPQQAANPRDVMQQVTVQITKAMNSGADKINIKLNPASLGRVEVQLEMTDGRITATVMADSKETLDLLKGGAKDLAKALNSAGLQTDSNDLEFSLREQGNQNVAQDGEGKDERLDFDDVADDGFENENDETALETALRDIITEGHVDIRA